MRQIMTTAVLALVAACGGQESDAPAGAGQPADSSAFDPLTDTLDRAESVEDTLRDAAAERRRQVEEQE